MEMNYPHVRTIPLKCAPSQAPCPTCGEPGKRKDVLHRQVRTIAYKQVVYLDITYGEYRARCDCCTTFEFEGGSVRQGWGVVKRRAILPTAVR